ncbi:hypothetical protein L195_g063707, partial [Trifolium pratense]
VPSLGGSVPLVARRRIIPSRGVPPWWGGVSRYCLVSPWARPSFASVARW